MAKICQAKDSFKGGINGIKLALSKTWVVLSNGSSVLW